MYEKILIDKKHNSHWMIWMGGAFSVLFFILGISMMGETMEYVWITFVLGIGNVILYGLLHYFSYCMRIVVTDKRVYGTMARMRNFDIPLENISRIKWDIVPFDGETLVIGVRDGETYTFKNFPKCEGVYDILNEYCPAFIAIRQREEEEKQNNRAMEFYKTCVQKGVTEIESEEALKLLAIIAKSKKVKGGVKAAVEWYEKGKAIAQVKEEADATRKAESAKQKALSEENKILSINKKYINLKGKEKLKKYYLDYIAEEQKTLNECEEQLNTLTNSERTLASAVTTREKDWALYGGIAEGLAGGAAGVATALEIQAENAQIRANNKANLNNLYAATTSVRFNVYDKQREAEEDIKYYRGKISKINALIVDEDPADDLIGLLGLKVKSLKRHTATGNVGVTVSFNKVDDYKMGGKIDSYIDGGFRANIVKDGKTVATTIFSLPKKGSQKAGSIKSVFKSVPKTIEIAANKAEGCEILFEPCHLWVMEQNDI